MRLARCLPAPRQIGAALVGFALVVACAAVAFAQDVANGAYVARAAGCLGCHTAHGKDSVPFAGGRELKTPFGSFFGPNITPDPVHGIGAWTADDFVRAMRYGVRPDGQHYFPAFPYRAFVGMTDGDLGDLWAYLRSVAPDARASTPHTLRFPFSLRPGILAWKLLYASGAPMADGRAEGPAARGAYLVEALGHCAECHTPRDALGGRRAGAAYAGAHTGAGKAPNITPSALGKWTDADLKEYLSSGMTPDGDFAGGEMAEVIRDSTSRLTADDLAAVVAYLRTLPAQPIAAPR
jgi:mono/diheme cytochrome c family protein